MGILRKLIIPFSLNFYMFKYRSIWKLREAMQKKCITENGVNTKKFIYDAYGQYFDKRASFVGPLAKFDGEPCFPHGPLGVFVSNGAKIGKDAVIFQNVTIGSNTLNDTKSAGAPIIGDNVYIGANAVIVGKVKIGNNCRIGAGATVYTDMPDNSVAVCAETRIIPREKEMDNRHFQHTPNGTVLVFKNGRYNIQKEENK